MTSSETSTEKALATRGDGSGPPAPRRGMSPALTRKIALASFVWMPAFALVAVLYRGNLTVGSVFIGLAWVSFALAAWYIGRAALEFDVTPVDALALEGHIDDDRRTELLREKKVLLKAIKEIEFDHQMGKIDDADAAQISGTYRARALEIMRLLDENKSIDYHAVVEKELAKRLAKSAAPVRKPLPPAPAPDAEDASGADPVLRPAVDTDAKAAAGTCESCGARNDEDAVFCKKCAARLTK